MSTAAMATVSGHLASGYVIEVFAKAHGPVNVKLGKVLSIVPNVEAFKMGNLTIQGLVRHLFGVLAKSQERALRPLRTRESRVGGRPHRSRDREPQ